MFQPVYHVSVSPTDGNGPTQGQIEFQIVLLTFKCLHGLAPQYLVDLIAVASQVAS